MGNDRFYRPGDYYQIDDITGIKTRASRTQLQWDGLVTRPESWSPRQPQDLVMGVADIQSVPVPRPRQTNKFTIVGTSVAAKAAAGATSITVTSALGFNVGNLAQVVLDNGNPFQFTVTSASGTVIGMSAELPGSVGTLYGDPIENAVINLTSVGGT